MAKIATSFVNHYKLTLQTSLPELSSYVEELASKLSNGKTKEQARKARDQAKRRFQELGLSKEQADILIPIRSPGRHVDERDPIKIIAQNIIKNNLSPEEINGIAYDLASSAPTTVAGNSRLNLLRKELRKLGVDYLITEATKIPFVTEEANQIQARKLLKKLNLKIKIERPDYSDDEFSDSDLPPLIPIFTGRQNGIAITRSFRDYYLSHTSDETDLISAILEEDYGLEGISDDDLIGEEIKCLDLQFYYKGKWRSLVGTEVIDFQIRKNPSFDLVLGQEWLWMHRAKMSFGFSSET
ncbi:11698_t:CDS:2, partial [Racocetra fulgida]